MKQPKIQPNPGQKKYKLLEDYFIFIIGVMIRVPSGFIFDGASIPRLFWSLIFGPFHPCILLAALIHDWLYYNHQVTRAEADRIFEELLIRNNTSAAKAKIMYMAVRAAGGGYYENTEKDLEMLKRLKEKADPSCMEVYHFPV